MVKIITPGQTEFVGFCERCGCEFSYELGDLKLSHANRIACPTCGQDVYHRNFFKMQETVPSIYKICQEGFCPSIPVPSPTEETDSCTECEWLKTLQKNGSYVGDTPCTWCPKNKFSCNTSGDSILHMGDYPKAYLDHQTTADSLNAASSVATIHLDPIITTDQADRDYVNKKLQEVYNATGCEALDNNHTCNKCTSCDDTELKNSCANSSKCNSKGNCKCKH